MLIYNSKKDFIGISQEALETLGFPDFKSLKNETDDFANLFIKMPGFIHDFQDVHWIDFIDYADKEEIQKVLIKANSKNFTSDIEVTYAYLSDNLSQKAYFVHLNNLRVLSEEETQKLNQDILEKSSLQEQEEDETIVSDETSSDEKLKVENISQDVLADTQIISEDLIEDIKPQETIPEEDSSNEYIYDPNIASQELGLPIDLVYEFIDDFVLQAQEFETDLYTALYDKDFNNIKVLSHKLKGVAANLRIEDAFEALATINTSEDLEEIKENLDNFYKIVMKLDSKESPNQADDELPLQIKDDTPAQENSNKEIQYSKENAAEDIGLDIDTFNEIFDEYIVESESSINKIRTAIKDNNFDLIKSETHTLNGMSKNMRVEPLYEYLDSLKNTTDKDQAIELINTIEDIVNQLSKKGVNNAV